MKSTDATAVPHVTTGQMIEVDRAMRQDYGIDLIQMMEIAGRNLAHLARQRFLAGDPVGKQVAVLAGAGGNGGGAMVAARRLHNWGANIHLYLGHPAENMAPIPSRQLAILERMGIAATTPLTDDDSEDNGFDLILDGLIGYGLTGAPRGRTAELIRWANRRKAPILALDTPSGIDTTTGLVSARAIVATATLTLALPKAGFQAAPAKALIGELYLEDIGVPPALYAGLGLNVGPLFSAEEILRLY